MPPDEGIAAIGPVDSEIGLLRLDRKDGTTLAVVYNFAMHPIQGVLLPVSNIISISSFIDLVWTV
ncbi:MAG: hypothetical protein L3J39_12700 [Verrucomicrobiales bacterium]|nr:hypothetical protein [Verrucomicrobiales bacterium]